MNQSSFIDRHTRPYSQPHVQPSDERLDSEAAEFEIIDLIQEYRPHLLRFYFDRENERSSTTIKRERASTDVATSAVKRNRGSFSPSQEQDRVHFALMSEKYRGKSCDSFTEFLISSPIAQLCGHPGILTRVYDLQFGTRGLSIMHFQRVGFVETNEYGCE